MNPTYLSKTYGRISSLPDTAEPLLPPISTIYDMISPEQKNVITSIMSKKRPREGDQSTVHLSKRMRIDDSQNRFQAVAKRLVEIPREASQTSQSPERLGLNFLMERILTKFHNHPIYIANHMKIAKSELLSKLKTKRKTQNESSSGLKTVDATPLTVYQPSESKALDERTFENKTEKEQSRYWKKEEHELFLQALTLYGSKDFNSVSKFVGTRTPTQVRTHYQKYILRVSREQHYEELKFIMHEPRI